MTWSDGWTSISASGSRASSHSGGGGDRRTGVAGERLEQDGLRLDADLAQLLVDQEAMILVADQQRCGEADVAQAARRRVLQQRPLGHERQELLGIRRARQRPQARAGAAGQDDRMDLRRALFAGTSRGCRVYPWIANAPNVIRLVRS